MAGNRFRGGKGKGPPAPPDQKDRATPPKAPYTIEILPRFGELRVEDRKRACDLGDMDACLRLVYYFLGDRHHPADPNMAMLYLAKALNLDHQGALKPFMAPLTRTLSSFEDGIVTIEDVKALAEELRRAQSPETAPSDAAPKDEEPQVATPGDKVETIKLHEEEPHTPADIPPTLKLVR
jgi:hypothetical protein